MTLSRVHDDAMKRRHFLGASLGSALMACQPRTLWALSGDNVYRKQIGVQLYTLRNEIAKDVDATIKAVVDAGYYQGEMYGFPKAEPMIGAARAHGLALHSSHFEWDSVVNPSDTGMSDFMRILEKAEETELKHLVIPYLQEGNRQSLDDYKKVAENCNRAAAKAKTAGIQLAYHNHALEFQPMEGDRSGYDVLMAEFGKEMQFEVDAFWVKVGGKDPGSLIRELKGRVSQVHLKDLKPGLDLPHFGSVPNDAFQELGDGIIPTEPILEAAKAAGVVHCHVEQDQSPNPLASIRSR